MNTVFKNNFEHEQHFSVVGEDCIPSGQPSLWEVGTGENFNPERRFRAKGSPLTDMVLDTGTSILEGVIFPQGLMVFLEQKFLPRLNLHSSGLVSLEDIVRAVFIYLDWQEPYFHLVDMPVSLVENSMDSTYKLKENGSVLDPEKLEVFEVKRGWNFPHYTYAHKILTDPLTAAVCSGQRVMNPKNGLVRMTILDILQPIVASVFSQWTYFEGQVDEWMSNYYEDLPYSEKYSREHSSVHEAREAMEQDTMLWYAVTAGIMTWFKSPHGLKFLVEKHPIYSAVLDWNYDTNLPMISPGSGGIAIVNGMTIYTENDVERLPAVMPGTCCVLNVPLHCTRLVNVKAVLSSCDCGHPRSLFIEEYWEDHQHSKPVCRDWERRNPPQMTFVSLGALTNVINKKDSKTPCQKFSCAATNCPLHAGYQARVWALTQQRTKMLTLIRGD